MGPPKAALEASVVSASDLAGGYSGGPIEQARAFLGLWGQISFSPRRPPTCLYLARDMVGI